MVVHRSLKCVRRFLADEAGLSTTEWAIMAALVVVASIMAIKVLGEKDVKVAYRAVSTGMRDR